MVEGNALDAPEMEHRRRLDVLLTQRELVRSRSQARDLIKRGKVRVDGQVKAKPGEQVAPGVDIQVQSNLWVGRGAEKLLAALDSFGLDPQDWVAADVGASTGGFTEVLLKKKVCKGVCNRRWPRSVGNKSQRESLSDQFGGCQYSISISFT